MQKKVDFLNNLSNKDNFKIHIYSKNNYPEIKKLNLLKKNVIQEYELPKIFKSSNCGMYLHRNLKTNNIPEKFVSYTQFGLPILCFANKINN